MQIATTPGGNEQAVADHTLALMLALLRRIPELDATLRSGGWNRTGPYMPRQLAGSTVGLVGYGAIGRRVAERLAGFDVDLLIHDPALRRRVERRWRPCSPVAPWCRCTVRCSPARAI